MSSPVLSKPATAHNPLEPTEPLVPTEPGSLEAQVHPQTEQTQHDSVTTRAEKHVRHAAERNGAQGAGSLDAGGSVSEAPVAQSDIIHPSTRHKGVAPIKPESVSISEAV